MAWAFRFRDGKDDSGPSSALASNAEGWNSKSTGRRRIAWIFAGCLTIALLGLISPRVSGRYQLVSTVQASPQNGTGHHGPPPLADDSAENTSIIPDSLSARQKRYIIHSNFERSKSDAAELATLARDLRKELDKPNADTLSAEVLGRIEKIEKLAKKIRDETKGF